MAAGKIMKGCYSLCSHRLTMTLLLVSYVICLFLPIIYHMQLLPDFLLVRKMNLATVAPGNIQSNKEIAIKVRDETMKEQEDFGNSNTSSIFQDTVVKPNINQYGLRTLNSSASSALLSVPHTDKQAWILMEGRETYLFSAYVDTRFRYRFIRVLCFESDHRGEAPLYCRYQYGDSSVQCVGPAVSKSMNHYDGGSMDLRAHNYKCPLSEYPRHYPIKVQLSDRGDCGGQTQWILVNVPPELSSLGPPHRFGVCISPRYNFRDSSQLVESIELNRYFGATSITLYNYSIPSVLDELLNEYISEDLVQMVQWNIPKAVLDNSHYFGQTLAVNDCMYRYMGHAAYVAIIDTDEFIVPHTENMKWDDMTDILNNPKFGSFLFRQVMFVKDEVHHIPKTIYWRGPGFDYEPIEFQFTLRNAEPNPKNKNSKVMVRPEATEYTGIHRTWKLLPGFRNHVVDPNISLLHHYKRTPRGSKGDKIKDESLLKLSFMKDNFVKMLQRLHQTDFER